ncbi:MAG: HEAT repeat domain-containing protein [Candidatus Brocadiia bacterium]
MIRIISVTLVLMILLPGCMSAAMVVSGKQFSQEQEKAALIQKAVKSLSIPDSSTRLRALMDICDLQAKEAIPDITGLLSDSDANVRGSAIYVLAVLEAKESIPEITKLLNDPKPNVRQSARRALRELGAADQPSEQFLVEAALVTFDSPKERDKISAVCVGKHLSEALALITDTGEHIKVVNGRTLVLDGQPGTFGSVRVEYDGVEKVVLASFIVEQYQQPMVSLSLTLTDASDGCYSEQSRRMNVETGKVIVLTASTASGETSSTKFWLIEITESK